MPDFVNTLIKDSPWIALVLILGYALYRVGKFLGWRLFDAEHGYVTKALESHRDLIDSMKKTNTAVITQLATQGEALAALERKVEGAYVARHNDPEIWRILFEENPVPMALVAEDGLYLQVNQALCRLTGYTSVEMRAMTWQKLTPPAEVPPDDASADELAEGLKGQYRMEKHYIHKDGHHVGIILYAFRYPRMGPFSHFVAIIIPKDLIRTV